MKKRTCRLARLLAVSFLFLITLPLFASETDDRIESSAKKSYVFKTYLRDDDVKIHSQNGKVDLTGSVSEDSHKSLAREVVATLPGVKSVDNKLEVKGETSDVHSDAWLITKVKSTLFFHRNVSATKTEVSAKDGAITLRGEAETNAQKDLTTEYAKDVEGVTSVKNEIVVSSTGTKSVKETMGEKIDAVNESIDDASITALVKTTLVYHRSTSGIRTTVETKDGIVTLGGIVKSFAEKDLATKIVSDVYGVNKVVNNMAIEKTVSKNN